MILFKELENPYIKECPFYDAFEDLLSKYRHFTKEMLINKLAEQESIYKSEESDGMDLYFSEENALAVKIIIDEIDPSFFIVEDKPIVETDRAIDIPDFNDAPLNSPLYRIFEKDVSDLVKECSLSELNSDLLNDIKRYNKNDNISLTDESDLYYSIQTLKAAIKAKSKK